MKKTLPAVLLLLLPSLSVICQAEQLTRHFIVELAQHQDTAGLATTLTTQEDHPFAINIMGLPGQAEGKNDPANQPSASSGLQASATATQLKASFNSSLNSGSGEGNQDPEQQQHTYGLNCYVDFCNGFCQLRPPSASGGLTEADEECPVCLDELTDEVTAPCCSKKVDRHCLQRVILTTSLWSCPHCRGDLSPLARLPEFVAGIEAQRDLSGPYNGPRFSVSQTGSLVVGLVCNTFIIEDGQIWRCGEIFPNASSLSAHESAEHSGGRMCDITVADTDGRQRLCWTLCRSSRDLTEHKRRYHNQ
ncbi:hypothetical protein [Endozoicomonas sp. 8E]|uniref:hypothetical protein n=1 Tax=Endozoicomonas sp. 8E TaxID=3035692 RepID=UPI00293906F8|nr:hypothetical protein [Endozoicomonas sp. 8E]WOG25631.1 hypothetical protein P6910_13675 [Endozoicomonas sp. 8E]